jgi:hypothetical protein
MNNETQSESLPKPVESDQPSGIARRRLLRAGMVATPVVLTLSGRSAMAATCAKGLSPLAWNSLAPDGTNCQLNSHTVNVNIPGKSPAIWQGATGASTSGAALSKFNDIFSTSANSNRLYEVLDGSTTSYDAYFCAAYLNAEHDPSGYPISQSALKDLYNLKKLGNVTLTTTNQVQAYLAQTW